MTFRFSSLLALAAVGVLSAATTANAAIVTGFNQIQGENREQLASYNAATQTYTSVTSPVVGDHLYGVLVNGTQSPQPNGNVGGVFDLVIAAVVPNPGPGVTAELLLTTDSATVLGQTGGLLTGTGTFHLADGSTVQGLGQTADSMVALYQNVTLHDGTGSTLDTTAPQGTSILAASDGVKYGDFGLGTNTLNDTSSPTQWGLGNNGYWVAQVTTIGTVNYMFGLVPLSQPAAAFVQLSNQEIVGPATTGADGTSVFMNYGLTVPTGPTSPQGYTLVGGGTSSVNQVTSPWPTTSGDPFFIDPQAPEPGTMLMMGLGLALGVPYLRRRKK